VCVATLVVHTRSLLAPFLRLDDFVILEQSLRWSDARANLWVPVNEHCWPVFRLATWAVARAAGGAAALPLACALAVRLMLLATVGLVYLFVRRERGHPYYGLVAAAAFGVTAVYQEAIHWYAACPAVGAAAFTMLALLAAQRWARRRRWPGLVGAAVWSMLAPGWYGGGILTGPLCAVYLWGTGSQRAAVFPLAGTAAFLALALSLSGDRILHADHHGSQSTTEALDPGAAVVTTARSVVDNLALGAVGVARFTCPPVLTAVLLVLVAVGVLWWWRRAPRRDLVLLGGACVVLHYGLVYAARGAWPYDTILRFWSRYNLFPWLGVVLAVAGGLRRPVASAASPGLTKREAWWIAGLIVVLMLVQLHRGIVGTPLPEPDQAEVLRKVDEVDAKCRAGGVSREAARRVLEPLPAPGDRSFDAYRVLRGGVEPVGLSDAEVRERLAGR
jgi:hypothetical protein